MAHLVEGSRVSLTVARPVQFGILPLLINNSTVEVREPRLDVSARHNDYCRVLGCSRRNTLFSALFIKLRAALLRAEAIRIDNNEKPGSPLYPHRLQFKRIPFPHPLLGRLRPVRQRRRFYIPVTPFPLFQEPPDERIGLAVLAKQNNADSLHACQSLATISDKASPSINSGGLSLTRTGPVPSRENQRPPAPPK